MMAADAPGLVGDGDGKAMFIVVCYDISEDKRRGKVCKVLQSFGAHVQESVFECDLTEKQYEKLRKRLAKHLKPEADRVRFYQLCQACLPHVEILGPGEVEKSKVYYYV